MTTYMDRALQASNSAQRNYDAGDFNAAANRAYYAAFYAVLALFQAAGENVGKTHSSTLRRFSQEFVQSGKASPEIGRALTVTHNLRSAADYSAEGVSAEEAADSIAAMNRFLDFAKGLLRGGARS
jgi:uncharacterized protein (UPF0332 family)